MPMTVIEKILARHAGRTDVRPGEVVDCNIDFVVQQGDFAKLSRVMATKALHPEQAALVLDHTVPAPTIADAEAHATGREFARRTGIQFYDIGRHGIIHQVIMERGWALPGSMLVSMDSHTIGSGAFNCAAQGLGAVEVMKVIAEGGTWFKVPETVQVELVGALGAGTFAKDAFLWFAGTYGSHEGKALDFVGDGVHTLQMDDRSTIATMCQEVSAEFATFPADEVLYEYLASVTDARPDGVASDDDAQVERRLTLDLCEVVPCVALPGSIPNNVEPVESLSAREIAIDQAFVGSCANGKLSDLATTASIVKGRQVASGTRLLVTPASQAVFLEAVRRGYVEDIVEAGGVVTNSTCGACYGGHMGVLGPGERCLTSSTRNFRGRMGSIDAEIFIGSSATVAASAIAGHVVDPRGFL